LKRLPTSFVLKPEEVDALRDAARHILANSSEFQRLIRDIQWFRLRKAWTQGYTPADLQAESEAHEGRVSTRVAVL